MIKLEKSYIERTLDDFRKKKILTIDDLMGLMHSSRITVRRYLKQWQTLTSFNKNGCYYVLPDIPKFNKNGLWQYKAICFSKFGSLNQTIIHLVENSLCGLGASEISQLIAMDPHPILSRLIGKSSLQRKKVSGVFVYFSVNGQRLNNQYQKRLEMRPPESMGLPSNAVGVAILVERIKNPKLSFSTLSRCLQNRGMTVSSKTIENFLVYHGIQKKR